MKPAMNPYQEYKTNQIDTADPKQLVIMLYDGAIKFIDIAIEKVSDFKTYDVANTNILKAQDIITELMLSLDMEKGGEIASNLFNLYTYMKKELLEANINKDAEKLKGVTKFLKELLEAWENIDQNAVIDKSQVTEDYKPFAAEG